MSNHARSQETPDLSEMLKVAKAAAPLSKEERAQAVRLAEQSLNATKLLPERKIFLTSVQTERNLESEKKGIFERQALLIYYRYAGDLSIRVHVNLTQQRTENVEQLTHFPASLASEEIQRAKELALNHPQLKQDLSPFRARLAIEPLLTRISDVKDPKFGHRLVNLLFRVGSRYLVNHGLVLVDLTTEEVAIIPNPKARDAGH